jgi:hypothetical protein
LAAFRAFLLVAQCALFLFEFAELSFLVFQRLLEPPDFPPSDVHDVRVDYGPLGILPAIQPAFVIEDFVAEMSDAILSPRLVIFGDG